MPKIGHISEHLVQIQLLERVRLELALTRYPELQGPDFMATGALRLYAVPNGGLRTVREGAKLKAEGVQRGVPDLCLPIARHGYHGLYLELKTAGGRLSPEQKDWSSWLQEHGYAATVAWNTDDAYDLIASYIDDSPCPTWDKH